MTTQTLILGGTGWLSGRVARLLLADGVAVTCLARGGRKPVEGAALIVGDRDAPDVYRPIDREWDHVIDVSSSAAHVAQAVEALGARAARWTFVSSVSVYADEETVGADESAFRSAPARAGERDDYAAQKVAAEDALAGLGERSLIVRPGLIAGEGDPSDRFGYWAAAFARAPREAVVVPTLEARSVQVIDVDDLADTIAHTTATGVVDAVGDRHPFSTVIDLVRTAAAHSGRVVEVDDARLRALGVEYWMGERSLPLWLPAAMPGFMTRSNRRYREIGGALRPLGNTIAAVLADERTRGADRPRRAGLSRAQELEVLAAIGADA